MSWNLMGQTQNEIMTLERLIEETQQSLNQNTKRTSCIEIPLKNYNKKLFRKRSLGVTDDFWPKYIFLLYSRASIFQSFLQTLIIFLYDIHFCYKLFVDMKRNVSPPQKTNKRTKTTKQNPTIKACTRNSMNSCGFFVFF